MSEKPAATTVSRFRDGITNNSQLILVDSALPSKTRGASGPRKQGYLTAKTVGEFVAHVVSVGEKPGKAMEDIYWDGSRGSIKVIREDGTEVAFKPVAKKTAQAKAPEGLGNLAEALAAPAQAAELTEQTQAA